MGQPAAKQGDQVTALDIHVVLVPPFQTPTPTPHRFAGAIDGGLSPNVRIMGKPAAVVGSSATNSPSHIPIGGPSFQKPPSNAATIQMGSPTVKINGKAAARSGDTAMTCNDPTDLPVGMVVAAGTVTFG